jgi:hypothetical protein
MDAVIKTGRRKTDPLAAFSFHSSRGLVYCMVGQVRGATELEDLGPAREPRSKIVGVALVHEDWDGKVYLMLTHDGWQEEDYFKFAYPKVMQMG